MFQFGIFYIFTTGIEVLTINVTPEFKNNVLLAKFAEIAKSLTGRGGRTGYRSFFAGAGFNLNGLKVNFPIFGNIITVGIVFHIFSDDIGIKVFTLHKLPEVVLGEYVTFKTSIHLLWFRGRHVRVVIPYTGLFFIWNIFGFDIFTIFACVLVGNPFPGFTLAD